jgi:hypothetical protein
MRSAHYGPHHCVASVSPCGATSQSGHRSRYVRTARTRSGQSTVPRALCRPGARHERRTLSTCLTPESRATRSLLIYGRGALLACQFPRWYRWQSTIRGGVP